jgi:WD40 repeat protein
VVALKMLLAGEFADAKARERLLREAKIAARLTHPGIVTIHEVGEHQGRPYFAMEFVPGRNLAQHCRDGLLPVATAVRYVEQLARAVHYAHQHGVIHRDLKPANVLISPDDEPKLTDFGLTKSLVDPTQTVESAGSPNFMAPEQADSALGTTGTPTDIYGLGAILYYLLTGRPPAVGETLSETLRNVVTGEPVAPRQLRPALPRDLETITLRCLEKEQSRRYGSAQEVAEELARWQRHEPILARPAAPAERLAKWVRRHPVVAALTAAVAVSLLGGLAATSWQWQRAEAQQLRAAANELTARRNACAAELSLANQAVKEGKWGDVRTILRRTTPGSGQPDLRGWEWRHLWQASRLGADGRFGVGTNKIGSLAALEDGHTVVLGETEGGFSLWDARSGRETYRLPDPINLIRYSTRRGGAPLICRVAVVPGTGLLAYTESRSPTNGFVHLWNVARRELVRSIPVPGMPRYLAASPDGTRVACSLMSPDRRVRVFSVADGAMVASIETKPVDYSACHALAFSADSRALCLEDAPTKCMRLVEIVSGRDLHRFPYGQDYPLTVAVSPDGRWLVTGAGFDNKLPRVLVWDLQTGEKRMELPASSQFALGFSPDGRRLVTGLSVWRVPEFTLEREFDGMDANRNAVLLLADGDTLLTEDGRGGVLRWRLSSPPTNRRGFPLGDGLVCVPFLPHSAGALLSRTNGQVDRAVAPDFKPIPVPALGTNAVGLAWITDPAQLAVARKDGSITLHAADSFLETGRLSAATNEPTGCLEWLPKARVLVVATVDDRLEAWDLPSRQRVWQASVLPGRELSQPTADGMIWQLHVDGWLVGYDFVRRQVIRQPLDHDGMHRLAVSPDGQWLLTTSPEGAMHLVDTRTWKTVSRFENLDLPAPHGGALWPNEDRIGFAGLDVVDRVTGRRLLTLEPNFAFHSATFISPDGSLVLAGSNQRQGYLWRAPSWEEIRRMEAAEAAAGW